MSGMVTDPFRERSAGALRRRFAVLGVRVEFRSDSRRLLALAKAAFGGLPTHRLRRGAPSFTVRLVLARGDRIERDTPPPMRLGGVAGVLTGIMDADNYAVIAPRERAALVSVSRAMLRVPRLARYELIEFATLTLLARALPLVSLHAGCLGRAGHGLMLLGESGAGKSTLGLQALVDGVDYLAEDSLFATIDARLATAVPAFLHVQQQTLKFLDGHALARRIRGSPVIERRSGVRKFELDLRGAGIRVAPGPLRLRAVVLLSRRHAGKGAMLRPLARAALLRALDRSQPQQHGRPEWSGFRARVATLPAFELRRAAHPRAGLDALRALLVPRRLK